MGLGRLIAGDKDRKKGKVSIIHALEAQVVAPRSVFSLKEIFRRTKILFRLQAEETTPALLRDAMMERFMQLNDAVYAPEHREKGGFHLSSLEDDCPRKIYYEFTEVEPTEPNARTISPRLQMIFDLGTWFHTYVQFYLWRAGILKRSEVPVKTKYMSSRADGIVEINYEELVLEIKTMNSYQFKSLAAPLAKHVYQASGYAKVLGIKRIIFLYFNKDTCEMKEFVIDRDEEMIAKAEKKMNSIVAAVETRNTPDRVCRDRFTERALNCAYCSHCFKAK